MPSKRIGLVLLVVVAVGCGGGRDASPGDAAAATTASAEGAMCEHGVLAAVCTNCNPKLIPVFQAKGDWCEEHGFPESFCPICHPERGGKPVADVAADAAPPDGTKVRLQSKDLARLAGIQAAPAEARPGGLQLSAVATVMYDPTKRAEINARAAGVVRALKVDLGTRVKAGQALAVIESAEVGQDRSRLQAAASRARVAEQNYEREKELHAKGISALKDVQAAEQERDAARAEQNAAGATLNVIGGPATGGTAGGYVLASPIAGTVTRRAATVGHMVSVDEVLFEVVDTSSMIAEIDLSDTDVALVAVGQEVEVVVDGLPDRPIKGRIDFVASEVDPTTRTAKARVALSNADGALKANMFAKARVSLGATRQTVLVPRTAVQRVKETQFVFVKLADDEYELRRVRTGIQQGNSIEITAGVKPGEPVVTEGSFQLKTETLKSSIGAGCCE